MNSAILVHMHVVMAEPATLQPWAVNQAMHTEVNVCLLHSVVRMVESDNKNQVGVRFQEHGKKPNTIGDDLNYTQRGKSSTQKRKNAKTRHSRIQTRTTKDCTHELYSRTQTHYTRTS